MANDTSSTVSIDAISQFLHREVDKYVAHYKKQHILNPIEYPLSIEEDNSGLWIEFFFDHLSKCESISESISENT